MIAEAEFTFNNAVNRSTGLSPFQIVLAPPSIPLDLVELTPMVPTCPLEADFATHMASIQADVRAWLETICASYKEVADEHMRFVFYQP